MNDHDKSKESSYLKCWDVNNLYGRAVSQKLPVSNFKLIEDTFLFNVLFIKNYNEESYEGYFSTLMFNILKNYINFTIAYHFYQNKWNMGKLKNL